VRGQFIQHQVQHKKQRESDDHEDKVGNACPKRVNELKGLLQEIQAFLFSFKNSGKKQG
jgi:hypothetical protein